MAKRDAAYWRSRAKETRAIADALDDPDAKRAMLDVARSYEEMANALDHPISNKSEGPNLP
jgi:hypothetical protein